MCGVASSASVAYFLYHISLHRVPNLSSCFLTSRRKGYDDSRKPARGLVSRKGQQLCRGQAVPVHASSLEAEVEADRLETVRDALELVDSFGVDSLEQAKVKQLQNVCTKLGVARYGMRFHIKFCHSPCTCMYVIQAHLHMLHGASQQRVV